MSKRNKFLASAVVVGALASVSALGVFGLFSATTQNAGNEVTTGTVALSDNDTGQALFSINGATPGESWTRCIKVTYGGSLPAETHMYVQRTPGPLEDYLNLEMHQGTQASSSFPGCNGFTSAPETPIFLGPLSLADGDYDLGLPVAPDGQTVWNPGDSMVFQMKMTLDASAPNSLQGKSTGTATIVWEARSQS